MSDDRAPSRRGGWRAALTTLGFVAAIGIAEAWARSDDGTLIFPTDGRRFATAPHALGTNAQGLNEREFDQLPDGPRVLVLGDSLSSGHSAPSEAWPKVAERPGQVWVNLAHSGYDAEQSLAALRATAMPAAWVVYAAYVNDVVPTELITVGPRALPVWVGATGWWPTLRARSALWRHVAGALAARGHAEHIDAMRWERAMVAMRDEATRRGSRFAMVGIAPHVFSTPTGCVTHLGVDGCRAANAALATFSDAADRASVPYLDTAAAWRREDGGSWFRAGTEDPHHPNAAGQAHLGATIADWFAALTSASDEAAGGTPN